MPSGRRKNDPAIQFKFKVEIEGVTAGSFRACSGLNVSTEVVEYAEGGDNSQTRKLIGPTKVGNITLRKGWVHDDNLWKWRDEIVNASGAIKRRSGSIVVLDDDGAELSRWNFEDAWPVRWEGPELDSRGGEVAVEVLEFAPERLKKM